jgi:DNA helicase-2/ATP-dependent DNA helicase PcrA
VAAIRELDKFDPTPEQSIVINHRGRPLVVVAGPGTGKTRTIVERMIGLLRENPKRVVSFITFTRTSRRDTDKKLRKSVDQKHVGIEHKHFPRISTLHGFAKSLVHRYAAAERTQNFPVLAQREKDIVIAEVIDDLGLALRTNELDKAITQFRATGEWPADLQLAESQRTRVIRAFDFLLKFYDTFDWEGLVSTACEILQRGARDLPPVLLQVDEYQDLNPKEQELIRLASGTQSSQVVVVGDDAQSIYGWRHAHREGIRELWKSKEWDRVRLRECHRLPPHILLASQSLIRDKNYLGGEVRLPEDDGRRLLTLQCTNSALQIKAVAAHIRSLLGNAKRLDGTALAYRDFMVLCPINAQVNEVTAQLDERYGIPTKKRSDPIPDDVWRLLLVLRMVRDSDSLALRQWLELAGLSHSEIRSIRTQAIGSGQSLYDHCSTLNDERIVSIFASIEKVRKALIDPLGFRQAALGFPSLAPEENAALVIDEMMGYLPSMMITHVYETYGVIDPEGESDEISDEDKVLVTTMHSAKGLEAECVFIMWLNSWFIPARGRDPLEEERVFYVALTRARQDVILTFQEKWDRASGRRLTQEAMSPFLNSIRDHLDVRRVTASDLR